MTLHELMHELDSRGVKLSLRLVVDAPRGKVDDQLRTALATYKPHLLARLGRDAQWEVLAAQRWGPALDEREPVDDDADPYDLSERLAIQRENEG
jgi:hypothetical protein